MIPALVLLAAHASGSSLTNYFHGHPWNAQGQGAMIVVDPDGVYADDNQDEGHLSAYHRQEVKVGGLTAIAPTEMVILDPNPKEQPNFYDGLPRQDKVFYFLSLLNPAQWKIASTNGIGLADLNNDQQAVYRSILPSTFAYTSPQGKVDPDTKQVSVYDETVTLSPEQEAEVRLHLYTHLSLTTGFRSPGDPPGPSRGLWSTTSSNSISRLHRKDVAQEDKSMLYGTTIRQTLPNRQKPSNLDYRSHTWDAEIQLSPDISVADLCKEISTASGQTVVPDPRVSNLPLRTYGTSARAGDLLQGLALCVTGAYRRVGNRYLLTSDLDGIGTRRLQIALWHAEMDEQLKSKIESWKAYARVGKGAKQVRLGDDETTVNPEILKFLERDRNSVDDLTMPVSELTPEWQKHYEDFQADFTKKSFIVDAGARPKEGLGWNFILPDGSALDSEEGLGPLKDLLRPESDQNSAGPSKPIAISHGALEYKTDDAQVALQAPKLIKSCGFQELWLQTENAEALKAALGSAKTAGVKVRLVIKPWESSSSTFDRTILGQTEREASALRDDSAWWKNFKGRVTLSPLDRANSVPPGAGDEAARWSRFVQLASTPGLAGTVVRGTAMPGYEPGVDWPGSQGFELEIAQKLGFTPEFRAAFLSEHGVDPIDITDTRLRIGSLDLSLPFFPDASTSSKPVLSTPPGALVDWAHFLSDLNQKSILKLANGLPGDVLIQSVEPLEDHSTQGVYTIAPWQPGKDFPKATSNIFLGKKTDAPGSYFLFELGLPVDPDLGSRITNFWPLEMAKHTATPAFDLGSFPFQDLKKILPQIFCRTE